MQSHMLMHTSSFRDNGYEPLQSDVLSYLYARDQGSAVAGKSYNRLGEPGCFHSEDFIITIFEIAHYFDERNVR